MATKTNKLELYYLRIFKQAIDQIISKNACNSINTDDVDKIYNKIFTVIDTKLKQEIPHLVEPSVQDIELSENNIIKVNSATQLVFEKMIPGSNELIAVGKLFEKIKVIKLNYDDLLVCISNGWRFSSEKCVPNVEKFTDSPYAVKM